MTGPNQLVADRYRIRERIGGGGMGAVWLARDELLGRDVALKQVLPPTTTDDAAARQQRERALREGRIAARLSHPHAISVYDVALENDSPWLVMEYLPSRSLSEVLHEDGLLREDQAAQVGAQIADALAATHAAGIVHRDVKPSNVLIGQGGRVDGVVKITDFGISHASGDVTLTQTGQITGTPAYLAPEVAQGYEPGPPADVFSLGATLYTCLEGEPPFGMAGNSLQQLHRVAAGTITPPKRCGSLTEPLLRMLSVDPRDRPAMTEVRDELVRLAAGRSGDTTTVLLARTDLARSDRPAGGPSTRVAPAAVLEETPPAQAAAPVRTTPQKQTPTPPPPRTPTPPPAAPPPKPVPAGGPPPARKRRVPRTALLAAAVIAVLAGLVLFWSLALNDPADDTTAADPSATASASPSESGDGGSSGSDDGGDDSSASSSAPASSSAAASSSAPPEETAFGLASQDAADYLENYHELVFEDPDAAYAQAGPTLQGSISQEGFRGFWGDFQDVELSNIRQENETSYLATMEFVFADGGTQVEEHRFTFVRNGDGQLVLDSDRPV